mgnify:CR=1 FL=1
MAMSTPQGRSSGMGTFVFIWFGQAVSMLGTGMTQFALTIWAYQMTGSATAAQRLLALDPADVATITFGLSELCETTAGEAALGLCDLSDPLLDTLAQRHAARDRPLFVS